MLKGQPLLRLTAVATKLRRIPGQAVGPGRGLDVADGGGPGPRGGGLEGPGAGTVVA